MAEVEQNATKKKQQIIQPNYVFSNIALHIQVKQQQNKTKKILIQNLNEMNKSSSKNEKKNK